MAKQTQDNANNLKIEEVTIGMEMTHVDGGCAVVSDKTTNSVEMFLYRTSKNGIDCKNWYAMEWFNRYFKTVEVFIR